MIENQHISNEEEAPAEKSEPTLTDPAAREYIFKLLNKSHGQEFLKVTTIKDVEGVIHQELSNQIGMISMWLGLYGRAPNKQSERAQSLLKKIKALDSKISELTTVRYLLDQPDTLILLRNAKANPVLQDELL